MDFGLRVRARIALSQRVVRVLLASRRLRTRLGRSRADAVGLDPATAAVLGLDDMVTDAEVAKRTPRQARRSIAASVAIVDERAPRGVRARDVVLPGPAGPLTARLYEPEGIEVASPGLLFLHGGGWVICDLDTHDAFCRRLAKVGKMRVVSLAYRLAPEHPFPAAVDDALAAWAWVSSSAEKLGIDPLRLGVGGDSAGGNLSAVLSLRTRSDRRRPALQALLYPALDATRSLPSHTTFGRGFSLTSESIAWYLRHYTGGDASLHEHPDVSPLLAPDLTGAPRALVWTAGFDPLKDEGAAYAARLAAAGVEVTMKELSAFIHGFALMTGVSRAARDATTRVCEEIGAALRQGP